MILQFRWDGAALKPKWMADVSAKDALVELYDHRQDKVQPKPHGEKVNKDYIRIPAVDS